MKLGHLQAIFKTPKSSLKKLENGLKEFQALDVFATGRITTHESVRFRCGFPPENSFKSLVKHNKSLRDVSIHMGAMVTPPDFFVGLVK